jgi:hypothetical protein
MRRAVPACCGDGTMEQVRQIEVEDEPVGIVISRGSRREETPRFSAYVWGPAPVELDENGNTMVAA